MIRGIPPAPPPPLEPRPFAFPAPLTVDAPWGGTIAVARVRTIPVVHVRYTTPRGVSDLALADVDPGALSAERRLLATTLRHGIGPYDAPGLAAHLDRLGARLSLAVSLDETSVSASGVASELDGLLQLLVTVLTEARATASALDQERAKALRMLEHQRADPDTVAAMWLGHALYGDHPYAGLPPEADHLHAVRPERLAAIWAQLCPPAGSQLLIVGDIDPEAVIDKVRTVFAPLATLGAPPPPARAPEPDGPPVVVGVVRPDSEQLTIQLGLRVVDRTHPDHLALRLAHEVLGAGAGSRLFLRLREAEGLTYDAWSQLDCGVLAGDLCCGLSAAPSRAEDACRGLLRELHGLLVEPPSREELASAQRQVAGSFPGKASGVGGVARLLTLAWRIGQPPEQWSDYPARVLATEPAAVERALQAHVRPARAHVVVVGPGAAVDAALAVLPPGVRVGLEERPDGG